MNLINNVSNYIIPSLIILIMIFGIVDKLNIFDIFVDGAEGGIKTVYNLLPTLIGIFFSIELLNNSGVILFLINILEPVLNVINIPTEILPLVLIRPISGRGAIGVATEIMKQNGVDSYIGNVTSVIMGATETTLYTIAVYTSGLKVNKSRKLIAAALTADMAGMLAAVIFCRIMSMSFS